MTSNSSNEHSTRITPEPPPMEENSCNICYCDLSDNMVKTPCSHYYCSSCFFKWMRESQTCPNCRKLLVQDSHIEALIVERQSELMVLNGDIASQYNIFRFLRRDTKTLEKENNGLSRKKRELEYLVSTKEMELDDLHREKKSIKRSIKSINNFRRDLEELDVDL